MPYELPGSAVPLEEPGRRPRSPYQLPESAVGIPDVEEEQPSLLRRFGQELYEETIGADPDVTGPAAPLERVSRFVKRGVREAYETEPGGLLAGAIQATGLEPPEGLGELSAPGTQEAGHLAV